MGKKGQFFINPPPRASAPSHGLPARVNVWMCILLVVDKLLDSLNHVIFGGGTPKQHFLFNF